MPFTIPNSADAAFPAQAEPDSRDFDIITAASAQTGVVTGCAVTTTGTTNGSVTVAAGTVRYAGRKVTVAGGTVAITANAAGNPRFDLITVDTSGALAAVAGTAAAVPVFPAIPASRVVLAAVYVANGHTTGTNLAANTITDKKVIISDAELENVRWYGATGNARAFTLTSAANSAQGVLLSLLATPTGVGTTTSTTTGALAAATYSYRVSAYNQYGETTASTAVTRVTTGTTSTVTVSWTAVVGAIGYKVYGRTGGAELLMQVVAAPNTSFIDRGQLVPSGALPGANTTGPFTSAMVGRALYLSDAGAAGAQYVGTVSAFTNAGQITVTPNLTTTVPAGTTGTLGTDDSAAIDLAVAALSSGSTLYFPAGQYLASTSGVVIDGKYNVTVTGDYATIIGITEAVPVVLIRNSAQIAVSRLRVQHATTSARNDAGYGIHIKWCQDVVISDNYVSQTCAAGIFVEAVARGSVYSNTVTNTLADGIHTTNASTDITVAQNRLLGTGDDSIAFVSYRADGNQLTRFTCTGNTIYQSNARGIGIVGAAYGSIVGNAINQTKAAGILVAQETAYVTFGPSDILVGDNLIVDANTFNSPSVDHAAVHINCQDAAFPMSTITVTGNQIRSPRRYGINADGIASSMNNVVITGNSFIGPSTDAVSAVLLGGSLTTCRVAGNRIAYASTHGIESYAARAVVQGNEVLFPNQTSTASIYGITAFSGAMHPFDNLVIQDNAKTALSALVNAPPTPSAAGAAGTSPPSAVLVTGSTDQAGAVTFGSGTGPGTGTYVFIAFRSALVVPPKIVVSAGNIATAALLPYVVIVYQDGFEIGLANAAAASQGNTTYKVCWQTVQS